MKAGAMEAKRRALYGALSGAAGTLALDGFRRLMFRAGLVHKTAPEQVVARLEELGVLEGISQEERRAFTVLAHYAYGVSAGLCFGLLRLRFGPKPAPERYFRDEF